MNVRGIAAASALLGLAVAGTASADHGHRDDGHRDHGYGYGYGYARVVYVEPIVRQVVRERPRTECWQEIEYRSSDSLRVAGTTLAGGVIGAAIGRQFGGGSGRDALTLIGAIAGSAVANEHARRRLGASGAETIAVPVERCATTVDRVTEQRVDGYWVTYRYLGRTQRIRTREHPGDRIRVEVTARPVGLVASTRVRH